MLMAVNQSNRLLPLWKKCSELTQCLFIWHKKKRKDEYTATN